MTIDFERWHDGVGYDLEALRGASPEERAAIEAMVVPRAAHDWRDVEALAALDTPGARAALRTALRDGDAEIRIAVARYAPQVVSTRERADSLVRALETVAPFAGLAAAIDEAAAFHPPEVVAALLRGARERDGQVAVHFAALLLYIHGQAGEPFDMAQRPFLLRFGSADGAERLAACRELCDRIGAAHAAGAAHRRSPRGSGRRRRRDGARTPPHLLRSTVSQGL